ncbi:TPA: response regulator [Methanosarcinaceae archaeon]|nr:response regulator [Methanosarcinaceae archaeon]
MNVSKKVLVIIYVIFALLISVVIFASQSILDSSFSDLEAREAIDEVENAKNVIDSQILKLDEANVAFSSRAEVRAFMQSSYSGNINGTLPDDIFSLGGYDLIFFVNGSGDVLYSYFSDSDRLNGGLAPPELQRKINDGTLLCPTSTDEVRGLLMLENGPVILSCRPIPGFPGEEAVLGTLIIGRDLDAGFVESVQKITGNPLMLYRLDSVPANFQEAFFESDGQTCMHTIIDGKVVGYFVLNDLTGEPAVMVRADMDRSIYAEGQRSLRYIVLFLLFAGLLVGGGCKFLMDREFVSRIVAIDGFVDKVGKERDYTERLSVEGDDELSRLACGINGMLESLSAASDDLKVQEHEKKVILNSLSELLVFMDPECRIVWANKASLDYLGMKLEDIVGQEFEKVCLLCESDSSGSPVWLALSSGKEEVGEISLPDGKVWMVRANPIKDEEGRLTGVLQTGLDITAHKRSEERLLGAKLEAEDSSRAKSEFLANMSHELRTPLNSIIGFSDILLERVFGELNERQLKYINNISRSGRNLLELINDILDLSKVEAGKMDLHYSEFSLAAVFEDARTVLNPLALSRSLDMTFTIEAGFSNLEADRNRLIQILYNLVSNAIKFTPDGGKVSIHCKKTGDYALISVTDTGIGISREDQKKLFQPFTQIDASASRQYCGIGLGLALVKKIVELHRGMIRVESELWKGSTFTLSIPVKKPEEIRKAGNPELEEVLLEFEMNKKAALSVKESVETSGHDVELPTIICPESGDEGELVLVVDDDNNSNELLALVLGDAGYRVAPVYLGRDVLPVAKKLKPDVITLDVFLPDTNGWLVLRQLKNDPETARIPVLIISMVDKNELGIALGALYSFTKPIKKVELLTSLEEIRQKFKFDTLKVLIVDDDEDAVELLNSMIEPEGFEVLKAYGGQEGLDRLFSDRPDILILDLMMSDVSGFDVISHMRGDPGTRDVPLIVCTAGEFDEKNIEELNNEMQDHLLSIMKKGTFGRKELINRIKQLTMLKRHNDEKDSDC